MFIILYFDYNYCFLDEYSTQIKNYFQPNTLMPIFSGIHLTYSLLIFISSSFLFDFIQFFKLWIPSPKQINTENKSATKN